MKKRYFLTAAVAVLCLAGASSARADVFYSGLQNISIPQDFNGVYVNVNLQTPGAGGVVPTPTFGANPNWDINPFFGGDGVYTSSNFRPARTGMGNQDQIVNLMQGVTIGAGLQNYAGGYGGSQGHTAGQFQQGVAGYIGYQYTPGGGSNTYAGWMRAILNPGGTSTGTLMDWAYETTTGATIAAGNIQQAATGGGTSLVTMTSTGSESPRLGSSLTDNLGGATSVVKTGAGTWTLAAANTYTGTTTVTAGTLDAAVAGAMRNTGSVTVNSGGTLLLSGSGNQDRVNDAAGITLAGGTIRKGSGASEGTTSSAGLGLLSLTSNSVIDFTSTAGVLTFAGFNPNNNSSTFAPSAFILSIINYIGNGSPGGADQLIFLGDQTSNLGSFDFGRGAGVGVNEFSLGNNFYEIYATPVPEPATWAAGILCVAAVAYTQRRRFLKRRTPAASTTL